MAKKLTKKIERRARRELPRMEAHEFRAEGQVALLKEVAAWFAARDDSEYAFLFEIRFELDEADLGFPNPYRAVVVVDGCGASDV